MQLTACKTNEYIRRYPHRQQAGLAHLWCFSRTGNHFSGTPLVFGSGERDLALSGYHPVNYLQATICHQILTQIMQMTPLRSSGEREESNHLIRFQKFCLSHDLAKNRIVVPLIGPNHRKNRSHQIWGSNLTKDRCLCGENERETIKQPFCAKRVPLVMTSEMEWPPFGTKLASARHCQLQNTPKLAATSFMPTLTISDHVCAISDPKHAVSPLAWATTAWRTTS